MAWSLPSIYPSLCFQEIRAAPKIREFVLNSGPKKFRHDKSIAGDVNKDDDGELYLSHLRCRFSTVDRLCDTHPAYTFYGTNPLIVTRTSHILSVATKFHEADDKISAYIDQRRAVHLRQLILM